MRKIPLQMIKPDMVLARSIYHNYSLLLAKGTADLSRYIQNLANLGIYEVYVEDAVSDGIEIPDAISTSTRVRCREALYQTLTNIKNDGSVDISDISSAVSELIEEIVERPDILVSLADIGTIDDSTLVHSVNTSVYALLLAQELNYSKSDMKKLAEGNLLHDIGKTFLNQQILLKPGPLTAEEFEHVKQHTIIGYDTLKKNMQLTELSRIIALSHHERIDGSGYPYGLKGNQIHEFAKVSAIADVFESLISERCYRKKLPPHKAIEILIQESVDKLDASMTLKFIKKIAVYPNGSLVRLSDMNYGIVSEQNPASPFRPIVRLIKVENGQQYAVNEVNLMDKLNLTIIDADIHEIEYTPAQQLSIM